MHPVLFSFRNPVTGVPLEVTTYAALMYLGAALAIGVSMLLARRRGLPAFDVFAAGAIAFGVGFLGARLAYLILNGKPEGLPWQTFLMTSGGLVWYGGFIGGALGGLAYLKGYRIPVLPILDIAGPGLALGHAFGRLGCFTAGCCHGRLALHSSFAVRFPPGSLAPPGLPLHPVQLYEAGILLLLFLLLLGWQLTRASERRGSTLALYVGGYACLRFVTEFFRDDDRGGSLLGLSPSQWISIAMLLLLLVASLWMRKSAGENDPLVKASS